MYLVCIEDVDDQLTGCPERVRPFVVFTALDATRVSSERLKRFARGWIELGCAWACAWGPEAERVEQAFDDAEIDMEPFQHSVETGSICTTSSHGTDSLDDALWFAVFCTFPSYGGYGAMFAVVEKEWAVDVETRLADSETWSNNVVAGDDEKDG